MKPETKEKLYPYLAGIGSALAFSSAVVFIPMLTLYAFGTACLSWDFVEYRTGYHNRYGNPEYEVSRICTCKVSRGTSHGVFHWTKRWFTFNCDT